MLKLTKLKLHNFCQFTDFSTALDCGLTAVVGPNGTGKTCMLRGIMYALTGIVDSNWGHQSNLQKDGCAEPGYAEVEFDADKAHYRIRRFSTSDVKFIDQLFQDAGEGEKLLASRRQAVNTAMQQMIGIPPQLMFQIFWGRQGRLDLLLTAPAVAINSFLQDVFNTKTLENIRDKIKTITGTVATIQDMSGQLEKARKELDALNAINDEDKLQAAQNALKECIDEQMKYGNIDEDHTLSQSDWNKTLKTKQAVVEEWDAWLRENVPGDEPASTARSLDNLRTEWQTLADEASEITKQLKVDAVKVDACKSKLAGFKRELTRVNKAYDDKLKAIDRQEDTCVLCGHPIEDKEKYDIQVLKLLTGEDSLEAYKAQVEADKERIQKDMDAVNADIAKLSETRDARNKRLVELQQMAKGIKAEYALADNHAKWVAAKREYDNAVVSRAEAADDFEVYKHVLHVPDDYLYQRAKLQGDRARYEAEVTRLLSERSERSGRRGQLEATIAMCEDNEERRTVNADARQVLIDLREIFSAQRAQAIFLKLRIQSLNKYIAQYLEATQMPFTLRLNEETHLFEYTTMEGFVHPACHLSGAQKSISSVVLQMAVLSVVNPGLNLFLIDEPAEALDDVNKMIMAQLFQRMSRLLPTIKGEMMIVTRDSQIIDSCDTVVDVSNNSLRGGAGL